MVFSLCVQEPLLTCTMTVLSKDEGSVQFITKYNEKAIKKRILAGRSEAIQLVAAGSSTPL